MDLEEAYRSSAHRLGRDFYAAVLPHAQLYRRAVGFFVSTVFAEAPTAFASFLEGGGRIQMICSPRLWGPDVRALEQAVFARPRVLLDRRPLPEVLRQDSPSAVLKALVARQKLDLRIAIRAAHVSPGMYHEKIGVFEGPNSRFVAFSGSSNESASAWSGNFERVDVFASWETQGDRRRAQRIRLQFEDLWRDETTGVEVISLIDAFRRDVLEEESGGELPPPLVQPGPPRLRYPETLIPPTDVRPYAHQLEALEAWGQSGGRAILEMATGSGKTITALTLASRLYQGLGSHLVIVIVAPLIHLVDQWRGVASRFALDPIRCAEGRSRWFDELAAAVNASNSGVRPVLSIATTSATLAGTPFQTLLARIRRPLLLIGDEVHNYGAESILSALPESANFRLGLSATPDRWMDEEGTAALREYFGPVAFRYGLRDAISDGVLTPYRYQPHLVSLTDTELDEYVDITRQLAKYLHGDKDGPVGTAAKRLLLRRARLVGSASGKLPLLRSLMSERVGDTHMLVYCGDGRVEGAVDGSIVRQVEEAVRVIGVDLGMRCASYTADTPPKRRVELLKQFSSGDLQVLVAIRCLDEGVDVPATREAFILASSTNPRQFIQRRGRVLRRFPGKRRAIIHDFFVIPPMDELNEGSSEFGTMRRLFGNQIRRAREFASLAENDAVARGMLLDISERLRLLTHWEEDRDAER